MAAAGPAGNLVIAALALGFLRLGLGSGWFVELSELICVLLGNDGLQDRRTFESNPMMSMVGLLVAWQVFPMVTHPLFSALLRLVHPSESYS